jgi:hypothetical protein
MMTEIEKLETLVVAVERAGVDIAPTYQEYMPMAFAVANSCGEQARALFHRLCALSPKYTVKDADKLFDNALKTGRNSNTLGTVWHLAERAGVDVQQFGHLDNSPLPPHTHTGARSLYNEPQKVMPAEEPKEEIQEEECLAPIALFPKYDWPMFVMQCLNCGRDDAQRDVLLLSVLTTLGATMADLTGFHYGNRMLHPCLQVFLIAPPASGKGVMGWARQLAQPIHEDLARKYDQACAIFRSEKQKWDGLGKDRATQPEPERPKRKLFFISGDNTGTGMLENLVDQDGLGMISESEASILSAAISSDYGNWSHTLRKAFDHDGISYNRRTNYEHRECNRLLLSVLISGTPGQLRPLIPSAENGLFSRELFYHMPPITEWVSQFRVDPRNYHAVFALWGERWKRILEALRGRTNRLLFQLNAGQEAYFDAQLARLFHHGNMAYGAAMRSAVARMAINLLRLMNVVAVLRVLDPLLMETDGTKLDESLSRLTSFLMDSPWISPQADANVENVKDGTVSAFELRISEEDFQGVMALAEPLYRHSVHALGQLPEEPLAIRAKNGSELFLASLPMGFTRQEALTLATEQGLSKKSCDKILQRMLSRGTLERVERGEYRISSHYQKEVSI